MLSLAIAIKPINNIKDMKHRIYLLAIMMAAVMSVSFSSCSGDNDDLGDGTKGGNGMDGTTLSLKLTSAGSLPSCISDSAMYKISRLKVSGEINSTDIWFLRQMAGCDENSKSTRGVLAYLDLSDATVVAGGRPYLTVSYTVFSTQDDVLTGSAFSECKSLVSVSLPRIKTIKGNIFYDCPGLTSITIPSTVTEIGDYAFFGSSGITSITIPASVTKIGSQAFDFRSSLTTVYCLNSTPPSCDVTAFEEESNMTLYVPKGASATYKEESPWCNFKSILEMQD